MGICTSKPKPRQQQKLEVRIQTVTNTQADRQLSQASFYRSIDRGYQIAQEHDAF
ncbi:unnamed protein product [Paramecium octaurelia]|uniref:Uncharacterized protein n=1 Tax=Paramecium octaurelia TaxID=43137 RepID=A0A8S1VZC1_PAROT|nr:unnamed protein product [Paramecium octaurelia]